MKDATKPASQSASVAGNGCATRTLRETLVCLETGSRPKGGAAGITHGVPSLSAEHMTRLGTFDFSSLRYVPREYYAAMSRGHIRPGDVLVVKDGATTGKVAFVDDDFPFDEAVINEHVFLCRPNNTIIEPRFLFYWLWGLAGYSAIRANFQGAAIGGINQSFADVVQVPVPSLDEQRRVTNVIREQLTAAMHAARAMDNKCNAIAALRPACIRTAFQDPALCSCKAAAIADISSLVIDGPHITPTYVPDGIPFVTVRNIVSRRLDFTKTSFITPDDHAAFIRRGRAEPGDILYTKDGTLGIPCVVDVDREFSFFVSVALIKLLRDRASPQYVAYALESPDVLQQVEHLASGAGLKHMVLKSIRLLRFPFPPLETQNAIADGLQQRLAAVETALGAAAAQRDAVYTLPSAIIRRAFQGIIADAPAE